MTEPVVVGDVEVEGNHIEVREHGEDCERKGEAPAGNRGRADLPKGGSHEGMRDDGGHWLRDRFVRASTPRCLTFKR